MLSLQSDALFRAVFSTMNPDVSSNIAFLFDLDGVVIDSEREYSRIWHEINLAFPTGVPDFELAIKGCTLENILSTYFRPDDIPAVKEMLYRLEGMMHYDYCPGADGFLAEIKRRGIPAALVTSSDKMKMAHLYEQHTELKEIFDVTVTADLITRSKPDPEGYLLAARQLGAHPQRCVVFEDSYQGMCAGKNAGALVVGIEGTIPRKSVTATADMAAASLAHLDIDLILNTLESRLTNQAL